MLEIAEYKEVRQFCINFRGGTSFSITNVCRVNYKSIQGKMAIMNDACDAEIRLALKSSLSTDELAITSDQMLGKSLFISKKSKISRDVLRNSYKIKLDPASADYIVFPKLKDIYHTCANLYGLDANGILWYSWINDVPDYHSNVDYIFQSAVDEFCRRSGVKREDVHHKDDFSYATISYITACDEYKEMILNRSANRVYIPDVSVPFTPLNKITPQTLKIWSRISETNVLEKLIVGSDWQKYPTTLALFLKEEQQDFESECGQQGKLVLDAIHYWENLKPGYGSIRRVDPEDWNMLQSYIFYLMGLDETKASYVNLSSFDNLPRSYRNFIKKAFAVQPVTINTSKTLTELYQAVR
jgi:hypothetical protein